jgi:hypothetical protein
MFKMPYHEYRRMKAAHKFWHLQYSDVIRDVLRKLMPVLESPSGEVREILERHREAEIEKAVTRRGQAEANARIGR